MRLSAAFGAQNRHGLRPLSEGLPVLSLCPALAQRLSLSLPRAKTCGTAGAANGNMPKKLISHSCLVFLLFWLSRPAVQGKVLGVFGDSVSDNGIGEPKHRVYK